MYRNSSKVRSTFNKSATTRWISLTCQLPEPTTLPHWLIDSWSSWEENLAAQTSTICGLLIWSRKSGTSLKYRARTASRIRDFIPPIQYRKQRSSLSVVAIQSTYIWMSSIFLIWASLSKTPIQLRQVMSCARELGLLKTFPALVGDMQQQLWTTPNSSYWEAEMIKMWMICIALTSTKWNGPRLKSAIQFQNQDEDTHAYSSAIAWSCLEDLTASSSTTSMWWICTAIREASKIPILILQQLILTICLFSVIQMSMILLLSLNMKKSRRRFPRTKSAAAHLRKLKKSMHANHWCFID